MATQKSSKRSKKPGARTKPGAGAAVSVFSEETASSGYGVSRFPVVAIGASAGGLAAFTALLKALPVRSGMAFVLIQHLEPKHASALTTLLSKVTKMVVTEISEGMIIEPDRVYVIPPNRNLTIRKGFLRLAPRTETSGLQRPIDEFCIALAEEQGSRAIGVVLSGTGSDGTYGLRGIKAAGGVTFAQDPKTAQWTAMPMSAITAGSVDFVLSPRRIALELARIGRHPYLSSAREVPEGSDLDKVCLILRSAVGVDFRLYKQATVSRRIARRMALHKIASLHKYAQFLKHNPAEPQALADDIFIHVTSFFRDPESFQALQKKVLAKLRERRAADKRPTDEPLRIWVAGCSSGEEVYSIAMLLIEQLGVQVSRTKIQIFGTDVQERSLDHARAGIYTESSVAGVSRARLKRFFAHGDHGYQILKSVRDLCVFARHDLTRDPPFSRMDLISCRNVLIYMGQALQKRILSTFQYALKPGGFLFLGTSESISDYSDAFTALDQRHRIFVRKVSANSFRAEMAPPDRTREPDAPALRMAAPPGSGADFRKEAESALLENYTPPALVVDEHLHIVHFQGDTSPYLAPPTGQPSFHLLKMVRPELVVDLRTAISKARKKPATPAASGVMPFVFQGQQSIVRLEVRPLAKRNGKEQDLLVVFQRTEPASPEVAGTESKRGAKQPDHKAGRLERELNSAREHLRTLIAEHETAQEEMKAANEEILSSNEELQSTNEELETAKEELQSSNEELVTLNDELQHRNAELNVLTHDLGNLLVAVDIPVLVLDAELRVRRFTPVAAELLNLIAGDLGRPFSNLASTLNVPDWKEVFESVTSRGQTVEREVTDREGRRYAMRVRPYRTDEGGIDGVLVVLLDTEVISRARDLARKAGEYAQAIVETIHESLVVVDSGGRVVTANRSFCDLFRVAHQDVTGKPFFGAGPGQCNSRRCEELLQSVLAGGKEIAALEIDQDFSRIGRRRLVINARRIAATQTALIAIEDATVRKQAQEELERSESALRALLDSASQAVITVREDGQIVMVNGNTEKMFGYSRRELIGKPVDLLIPEPERGRHAERHRSYFADMMARPMAGGVALEARRKDGVTFPAEISLSSIPGDGEKLAVAFVSDTTARVRMEKAAQTHAEQIQALAARLLTAQEEERRRVSRELHDQICQQLASLAIDISGLASQPPPPGKTPQVLKTLQTRVIRASEATRHIAYELHPSVLDDLGLVASLRVLCKEFSEREGVAVQFHSGELPPEISREIGSCLYRVAQESLHNVALHSGAKKVSVSLAVKKNAVALSVVDDGTGFDPAAARGTGGLGLIGMEERARLVKGKLTIEAQRPHGTRVTVVVPLPDTVTRGITDNGAVV